MKRITCLIFFFSILGFESIAQYRCLPDLSAYHNPGHTTTILSDLASPEVEYGYSVTPIWEPVFHLDFPFYFNGQPVSAFKVSTTGILTFDTATSLPPYTGYGPLPNAQVPDQSICISSIFGRNTNSIQRYAHRINYETPVPSMQLWVFFSNYVDTNAGGGHVYTSWAIVLEENTNHIYIVDQATGNYPLHLTLGIQINSTLAFMAPVSPNINSRAGYGPSSMNNHFYQFIPESALNSDGTVISATLNKYVGITDAPFIPGIRFRNLGTDTVHSLQLNYRVNGGPVMSANISSLAVALGAKQFLNSTLPWTPPDTGIYLFDYWVSNLSSGADADTSNDHFIQQVWVGPAIPHRRILYEEFKGVMCMWSGYYSHPYDSIINANSNKASSINYEYYGNPTPPIILNQQDYTIRGNFYQSFPIVGYFENGALGARGDSSKYWGCTEHVTQQRLDNFYDLPGLFYVQPQLVCNGYTATVTGTVTSAINFPSGTHCKFFVSIIEDSVFYQTPQGSSDETLFVNSLRKMLPDANGIFIGTPHLGQVDSLNFSYTITNQNVNLSRLRVIAFVQDTVTKEIYQCGESPAVLSCNPVFNISNYEICIGDSILIEGNWVHNNGSYPAIYTGANGCDSLQVNIVRLHGVASVILVNGNHLQWSSMSLGWPGDTLSSCWFDYTNNQIIPGTCNPGAYPPPYYPTQPGLYALIRYNQMGCVDTSNVVIYNCTPDTADFYFSICSGDSLQIGSNWYDQSGVYSQMFFNASGCDSMIYTHLTVHPASFTQSFTVCYGQSVVVGASTYSASGSYTDSLLTSTGCDSVITTNLVVLPNNINNQSITVCYGQTLTVGAHVYSVSGNYSDTLTTITGCDSIVNTNLLVSPPLIASITPSGPTTFCQGGIVTLTASGANNYLWSNGSSAQSINITSPGNYVVTVTDGNNCSASASQSIIVNPLPAASITPSGPTTFCQGNSVTLTSNAASSYLWSNSSSTQSINVTSSGNYIVTVTDGNSCTASTSLSVTVNPLPNATITPSGPTTICAGNSVTLTSSAASSYSWSNSSATQSINVTSSGNYIVTVTDVNNCFASTSLSVTVNPLPNASITQGGPTTFCEGNSVTLTANAASSYLWSNNSATQSINVTSSGNYTVTVTDANNCSSASPATSVTVNPNPPVPAITQSGDSLISDAANGYQWYFNSVLIPGATSQSYHPLQNGNYSVVIAGANNCTASSADYPFVLTDAGGLKGKSEILIYPNPARGELVVRCSEFGDKSEIIIDNLLGEKLFSQKPEARSQQQILDVSALPRGIYFIKVNFDERMVIRKIVLM